MLTIYSSSNANIVIVYGPLILEKIPKRGVGVKAMPIDLEHFKRFCIVEFH